VGTRVDVANACLFSASEAASYITGSIIMVEGGSNLTIPNFAFVSKDFVEGYPTFGKSKL
jgi:enoyl-[acyl-carrier-protein] reductase (NADH)